MSVTIKMGQSAISGYVGGVYNKEAKGFAVKRGQTKAGKRYQVFVVKVASKDKESGKYTNGKDIEVMLFGDTKVEEGQSIGLLGRFQPNNYMKDDKEVKGMQFLAFADDIFEPEAWDAKTETKSKPKAEPDEWDVF